MKIIDLNEPIATLIQNNDEIKEILFNLGFTDIIKPVMLNTVGKIMTLNKGSKFKNIDIEKIKQAFIEKGYEIKE